MIKLCAFGLILLLLFNTAGPVILLVALRSAVRIEVASMLKSRIPEEQLETIAVPQAEQKRPGSAFRRINDREFRYRGKLYDIVSIEHQATATVYRCINDKREEELFRGMDELIRNSLNKKKSSGNSPFRLAVKNLITCALFWIDPTVHPPSAVLSPAEEREDRLPFTESDIPTPPPKSAFSVA